MYLTNETCMMMFNSAGKFVCVKGTVVRVGNIKPLCTELAFECAACSFIQVHGRSKYFPPLCGLLGVFNFGANSLTSLRAT